MTRGRALMGAVATVGLVAVMAWATAAPWPLHRQATAMLRLSWTARPEWIETCRRATDEELARLEAHMRQRILCDGAAASYDLTIALDGTTMLEEVVRGGGVRHDRPMHVLLDQGVPSGRHRIRIAMVRREAVDSTGPLPTGGEAAESDSGVFAGRAAREIEERARRVGAAVPPRLELDTIVELAPRRVLLVTYDPDRRRLALVSRDDD